MNRTALAFALIAAGCSDRSLINTPPDAGSTVNDAGQIVAPSSVTFGSEQATVVIRTDRFGMRVLNAAGRVLLDSIAPDATVMSDPMHAYTALGATHRTQVLRSPIIEGWDHVIAQDAPWHHAQRVLRVSTTATSASLDLVDPTDATTVLHVEIRVDGAEVRVDVASANSATDGGIDAAVSSAINEFGQAFVLGPDEHFFGLGERSVTVDHRGRHFECWVEEGGLGLGENATPGAGDPAPNGPGMTGIPIPFLISTRGYGLWIDTTYRTGFSMGAEDRSAWRFYAVAPTLSYRIMVHDDPRDTISHFTALTGRATLPAPWVFGPRRRVDHGMVMGEPEEQALRDHHVPTTMVDDTAHFLPINGALGREDFLRNWTAQMHALGFKTVGYFNPYVSVSNPAAADLIAYGRAHDLFLRLDNGTEFDTGVVSAGDQRVATIDFTNPAAVDWYQTLIQQALDLGYDGWMLDFGEYLPANALMHDGRSGWEVHNEFPVLVQRATFDYVSRVRGRDFQYFVRSGYTGTQAVTPMLWSGDPSASFDDARGIPGTVRAGLNAGISGLPYWGSDVSGYTCLHDPPADKEVYLRWAELGAFSPDMHDENACGAQPAGSPPKWTLWSDAETTDVYGRYALLHTRIIPYLYAAAKVAQDTGVPIMRHPFLVHHDRPETLDVQFEYYYGPALYVAPVVHRGDRTRTLWLPPGQWVDWWTSAPVVGGAMVTRDAPLDVIPVYLRSGGVVAMLDASVQTLAPRTDPNVVSMDDVRGVLDVRAAIDPATAAGRADLADGTVFEVALATGAPVLPAGVSLADEATLATCTVPCGRIDPLPVGGAMRVRITSASAVDATFRAGALTLHHHAPSALRTRWDVVVLPTAQ